MHLLFESPAGYALFQVLKSGKLDEATVWEQFQTVDKAKKIVSLKGFCPFTSTADAVAAATSIIDGRLDKSLKKFLKKEGIVDDLAVCDLKLGGILKEKMDLQCVNNNMVMELFRGIRGQMDNLIDQDDDTLKQMQL